MIRIIERKRECCFPREGRDAPALGQVGDTGVIDEYERTRHTKKMDI